MPVHFLSNQRGKVKIGKSVVRALRFTTYRLLTNKPVTWRWMFVLSAMDIVLITAGIVIGGGFGSYIFLAYYPALAMFAVVFTSFWLGLASTTVAAVAYVVVSSAAGSGFDVDAGDEKVLLVRSAMMYAMVLCISLIHGLNASGGRLRWKGSGSCSGNASSSP